MRLHIRIVTAGTAIPLHDLNQTDPGKSQQGAVDRIQRDVGKTAFDRGMHLLGGGVFVGPT